MTFKQLYDQYNKLVFNLALQYVPNVHDAEEICQDVFLSVHQNLDKFNHQAELKTWIYRIAINKSLDFIKAKKTKKRFAFILNLFHEESNEIRYDSSDFNHPGVMLEQQEATHRIFKALDTLNENQRTAIILCKIEQKTQKEAADIMDINIGALESLLSRALKKLEEKLHENEG